MSSSNPIRCTLLLIIALGLASVSFAQAIVLKPAMARIMVTDDQSGGNGFVFRYDDREHIAYLLTNEHVVRGVETVHVSFYSSTKSKPVDGAVIRRDSGKDLAVVKVSGSENIPHDLMLIQFGQATALMPGDPIEVLSYSAQDEEWSVMGGTVRALRDEALFDGSERVHVIRFAAPTRAGDSGSPLIRQLRVFGVVQSAPLQTGDTESPVAIQVATIEDFLEGLLPPQNFDPPPLPSVPPPPLQVDREAQDCALSFLNDLIGNNWDDAYALVSDLQKSSVSLTAFKADYGSFAAIARAGLIDRKLGDAQVYPYLPAAPAIAGRTYLLTFESTYRSYPTVKVYETVTVIERNGVWQVFDFRWITPATGGFQSSR